MKRNRNLLLLLCILFAFSCKEEVIEPELASLQFYPIEEFFEFEDGERYYIIEDRRVSYGSRRALVVQSQGETHLFDADQNLLHNPDGVYCSTSGYKFVSNKGAIDSKGAIVINDEFTQGETCTYLRFPSYFKHANYDPYSKSNIFDAINGNNRYLLSYNGSGFDSIPFPIANGGSSIYVSYDPAIGIWSGTHNMLYHHINGSTLSYSANQTVSNIRVDQNGKMFCRVGSKVATLVANQLVILNNSNTPIQNNWNIYNMEMDASGKLWFFVEKTLYSYTYWDNNLEKVIDDINSSFFRIITGPPYKGIYILSNEKLYQVNGKNDLTQIELP